MAESFSRVVYEGSALDPVPAALAALLLAVRTVYSGSYAWAEYRALDSELNTYSDRYRVPIETFKTREDARTYVDGAFRAARENPLTVGPKGQDAKVSRLYDRVIYARIVINAASRRNASTLGDEITTRKRPC